MSRFYIRVYKDNARERTWGCGSRSENNKNLDIYLSNLKNEVDRYRNPVTRSSITHVIPRRTFGTYYRFELIKDRHGEKHIYREVELVIAMTLNSGECIVSIRDRYNC